MSRLTIEYCVTCNYYPRAAGLAEELERKFGLKAQLIKGSRGIFDVTFEGELLFSKIRSGRFPEPGEAERLLEKRLGQAPGATIDP